MGRTAPADVRCRRDPGVDYIFWNHHEEEEAGRTRFDGNRDLAGFIRLADELGLGVILRVGPWSHGEARYGGFPNWVQHSGAELRTDDPRYLKLVEQRSTVLGCRLRGRSAARTVPSSRSRSRTNSSIGPTTSTRSKASCVVPAWWRRCGPRPSGAAQVPGEEVLPLYGGYPDGLWMDHYTPWDDSFRSHFYFSHEWDDTQLGADVRDQRGTHSPVVPPSRSRPSARS